MDRLLVVNGKTHGFLNSDTIYIGRKNSYYQLLESPLANPFVIGKDGGREEVIAKYRRWLWNEIKAGFNGANNGVFRELVRIAKLVKEGKKVNLACYCKPKECHGDVLVKAINWLITENLI